MSAPAIIGAIVKVMAEVGVIAKGNKNTQQNYAFRGIDDVVAGVQEAMARNGIIVVPRVVERERDIVATKNQGSMVSVRLLVDHVFMSAEDGSSVVCTMLGEAFDSGDKASNKAMSAALKYAITETFMIATYEKDRDTEEHSPQIATPLPSIPSVPMAPPVFAGERDSDRAASAAMDAVRRSAPSSTPPPPKTAAPPAAVPNSETASIGRERIAAAKNMAELAKVGTDLIKLPDWKTGGLREAFTLRQQQLVNGAKAEAARGGA